MGAFDHLEWTYDGAFEQLFGLGRGEFEQKLSKNSNARGVARGGCLSFDLTGTLSPSHLVSAKGFLKHLSLLRRRQKNSIAPIHSTVHLTSTWLIPNMLCRRFTVKLAFDA